MAMSPNAFTKDSLAPHVAAGRLVVGPHTYGPPILRYWGSPGHYVCRIGDYCSIADNVQLFLGGYHRPEWVSMYPFTAFAAWRESSPVRDHTVGRGDVVIGSDVWMGSHCTIMSGVSVGHGAVIAAMAVVTKDVPPYAVVAGNPARVVKMRFDDAVIAELLAIAWWDWPEERIRDNLDLLLSGDMAAFIARNRAQPHAL
ncbi:MAG: CatB-related O-acetyltransferase [Alphaproteobacteria bacterium]|nr:CatB-related O-acetyltransferase [Alphaproteobacteria bacterium]MBU1514469.1 CatB-related O-acetyltransferase [Alphaproteobacteria bacterium]MBU2096899.1 CatB-related O-acetyltransferase [Alphaproteobacteria bacterium]MBU2153526.1 CatB-related O-acetyltransferase [Alphaproteobacteria bacterium]MBU2305969.1 CatB-related O-acetyltransferase [Alphaproteobacteria bacterium]